MSKLEKSFDAFFQVILVLLMLLFTIQVMSYIRRANDFFGADQDISTIILDGEPHEVIRKGHGEYEHYPSCKYCSGWLDSEPQVQSVFFNDINVI